MNYHGYFRKIFLMKNKNNAGKMRQVGSRFGSLRKEVYIPIEIKAREFVSQVYLAGELSKNGARVFIGSKSSMDRIINDKNNKKGVFLYKGGGSNVSKFKNISKKVSSIAVMDQEVSPASENYNNIRMRFVEGSLQYVSRLYYVGDLAREAAINCFPIISPDNIKAFGWPRVDLWHPSMHHISINVVKKIHLEIGDNFILFSSDFGVNSKRLLDERLLRLKLVGAEKTDIELESIRKKLESNYSSFGLFLDFLRELDSDSRIPTIIVRPHPSEDHDVWRQAVDSLTKTKVIYRGDITPWLLASKGLLHRGCTTSIQASISEVKTGLLVEYSNVSDHSLVSQVSTSLQTLDDVANWVNDAQNGARHWSSIDALKDHISLLDDGATKNIALDLISLAGDPVEQSYIKPEPLLRKFLLVISRRLRRKNLKNKNKNPYQLAKIPKYNKMQGGISLNEVDENLMEMYPDERFHVFEITKDLICIEIS